MGDPQNPIQNSSPTTNAFYSIINQQAQSSTNHQYNPLSTQKLQSPQSNINPTLSSIRQPQPSTSEGPSLNSPSYLRHEMQQANNLVNQNENIVGPSDHYGVHHNFNRTGGNLIPDNLNSAINNFKIPSQKETKVCVIVDSRTPVIFTIPLPPSKITLADLKAALPAIDQPNYKYFFKSSDSEFGIVKEEIQENDNVLPTYKNRVVAWIVTPGRIGDELASSKITATNRSETDTCNLTYSNTSYDDNGSMSLMTTDMDTTSYFTETDDDSVSCSNYSETTCDTFISQRRNNVNNNNPRQLYQKSPVYHQHHRNRPDSNSPYRYNNGRNGRKVIDKVSTASSSSSSLTNTSSASHSDATAVHCLTVHLVLTNENFLGLHIYANAINGNDEGIYVDGVTENSAVAQDGRIEPGDKLIQVNDINLEELSNSEAVKVLKDAVIKRGPLKLVVAKFVETNNNEPVDGIVRDEIHPIDTAAWVEAHANAITTLQPDENHDDNANSATSSPSFGSRAQDTDCIRPSSANMSRFHSGLRLSKNATDIKEIILHMKMPEVGLNIKDREWLKINIPKAFLGSDLVTWLERNVYGFTSNKEAKKFAARMLKDGYIRDPISKKSFSSKSYYTFVV